MALPLLLLPLCSQALTYDGKQHEKYPYPFVARTRIAICDDNLQQELEVTNTGTFCGGQPCKRQADEL